MIVDKNRTVCLEDYNTMRQKNSWCSWCVRVFVGGQDELWNTCGVGILTLCAGDIVVNTSQ
jgi:hypothetical protein